MFLKALHTFFFLLCFLNSNLSQAKGLPADCADSHKKLAHEAPREPLSREVPTRAIESIQDLRIGTYNFLNLFLTKGKFIRNDIKNPNRLVPVAGKGPFEKNRSQLEGQAKAILESNLDVVCVQEVESKEALEKFNEEFLGDQYRIHLIEGNDERGIDVGFLVKKDLPLDITYETHKEATWQDPMDGNKTEKVFSRDLPVMIVREKGREEPLFIMAGTHFKSKRDRPGDPNSNIHRAAQVAATVEILKGYVTKFGPNVPILMAGDFNGVYTHEKEFETLRNSGLLMDAFSALSNPPPESERVTHTYHPQDGQTEKHQMDFLLVSPNLKPYVKSVEVYRYKDQDGNVIPIPNTYKEREKNPSDHFPVFQVIDFQGMRRLRSSNP